MTAIAKSKTSVASSASRVHAPTKKATKERAAAASTPASINAAKDAQGIAPVQGAEGAQATEGASMQVQSMGYATGHVTGRDVLVPLNLLAVSVANVRKVHNEEGLAELAALIESQGLLQRLSIVDAGEKIGDGTAGEARFDVVAGGRRLRAMQRLVAERRWPADQLVECKLYDASQSVELSLAENSGREGMHPADQMEAFKRLVEEGLTTAQVAGRFGVSTLTVERRLKLARLSPRFLDLYRMDEIEPDQLMALALLDDPAAQEAVWDGLNAYDRSAWRIRNLITAEACAADSRLAVFVGLDAYEAEGGVVRRDLFSSPDDLAGIYLENPDLLQRLALEKLRGLAASVKDEGWSWVECVLDADRSAFRGFSHLRPNWRQPTEEEAQAIEALDNAQRACAEAYDRHMEEGNEDAEDFDEVEQRLGAALEVAQEQREVIDVARRHWDADQLAMGGAVVRIEGSGQVVIERGLVRPEDRKAKAQGQKDAANAAGGVVAGDDVDGEGQPRDEVVNGTGKPEYSERLMRDLTAHRTAAIQAALVQNPHVALVTLVHRMAETVFGPYGVGNDIVKVTIRQTGDGSLGEIASEYADSPAAVILGEAETQWGDRLPGSPEALFAWLLAQPQDTLLELLAFCTARSVDAVIGRGQPRNHSDALVQALGVDMADWWLPTPKRYLDSISKAKALEAVKEATGHDETKAIAGMKKNDVVAHCANKLEGSRWLPTPLRVRTAQPQGVSAE